MQKTENATARTIATTGAVSGAGHLTVPRIRLA